jgi:Asp-tRNA(Asn)/Glu-tRNA(Gln) amidotransferase A subunit family amidase
LGTDIGGWVRIPASFCGVFGHKPSFGVVPQRGYLDHVGGGTIDADVNVFGPLARSVEDLELLLGVLAGPVADDVVAWRLDLPEPRATHLAGLRIGTWLDDPKASVDSTVGDVLERAAGAFASAGAKVTTSRPPLEIDQMSNLYLGLVGAPLDPRLTDKRSQGRECGFIDFEAHPALPGEVFAGQEGHRWRLAMVGGHLVVQALEPIGSPASSRLEEHESEVGVTLEDPESD